MEALEASLKRHGWDYDLMGVGDPWVYFGAKLRAVHNGIPRWKAAGYTHCVHVDAFDVVALAGPGELREKMGRLGMPPFLLAAEVGCWPDAAKADRHPPCPYPWRYAHSLYVMDLARPDILDGDQPDGTDDQDHLMTRFLSGAGVALDYECRVFQALAHLHPWTKWFEVLPSAQSPNGVPRVANLATGELPVFFHGNGRTDMSWLPRQ